MSGVASQYISRGKPCAGYDAGAFHNKADGNDHATTAAEHGAPEAAPTKSLHQQALDAGEQDEQDDAEMVPRDEQQQAELLAQGKALAAEAAADQKRMAEQMAALQKDEKQPQHQPPRARGVSIGDIFDLLASPDSF